MFTDLCTDQYEKGFLCEKSSKEAVFLLTTRHISFPSRIHWK
jgi:hypothetical protein